MDTTDQTTYDEGQRPAQPGEQCSCGRSASTVYLTESHGEVPWCGLNDGGPTRPPSDPVTVADLAAAVAGLRAEIDDLRDVLGLL